MPAVFIDRRQAYFLNESIEWTREQRLLHPSNGTDVYGLVPQLNFKSGPPFPAGAIHLKYGEHRGKHRGFGFQHIWREHCAHIVSHDEAMAFVCEMVAKALRPNTAIYYEFGERLEVFSLRAGQVIIELARTSVPETYSVVTAGYKPTYAKGSQVGALKRVGP
ncbi:hypothetical protein J7379_20890 [Xanthomonas phaseoli pv. dieffenbachiae]|uniref:hypothetical protein n=1 Tax=Xanthomonas phaseoli TaxID=1985254 RepID=UPI001364CA8A|nr:hypothetical protein [Xanthomonas phaseoli]MBO9778116.1 hypothetical protein [Xanthomonas phaseoli pv. dieffenbachiae]MBO9818436.1 hypothetical protein [Xanthomonas phaseoli pv. dieffenbachiae]MBO9822550.1 hypothetical protein [Xanthomonas phaseoli pv. dieffenbachiae]MBO9912515.1 hypothetical protein [Xanthomonas phaseoli pv. dieffenbachiae]MBO9948949.1 hypothetical protein [Xanthomonas phaseoli pv. dieffenbachiae]